MDVSFPRTLPFIAALLLLIGSARAQQSSSADADSSDEWITLFDGTTTAGWTMAGPGGFVVEEDSSMLGYGGMGMLYYHKRPFRDFILEFDWKAATDSANSGVFVRFPEASDDPWDAVHGGYEIQIDDSRDPLHRTGSIYTFSAPLKDASKPAGEWNTYRIEVTGQRYQVYLNGEKINDFFGERGREGYIGVQNHDTESKVWYRDIRVKPLEAEGAPESLADYFEVDEERDPIDVLVVTTTHGFRHEAAIEQLKETLPEIGETTEFAFDFTEDPDDLNADNLENYDVLLFANSTMRVKDDNEEADAIGAWRTYDLTLETPDGTMPGRATLSGSPESGEDLRGTISFQGEEEAATMQDLELEDEQLTFNFDGGPSGTIHVEAVLEDSTWDGTMEVMGASVELTGTLLDETALDPETVRDALLAMAEQQQAILDFLRAGKGVAVAHAGLDAFYDWPEYREMVGGGLFESHPWTQPVDIVVEEENPATEHFDSTFSIRDEIYVLDENPRWNSRVLLSLDMNSVDAEDPAGLERNDYPISWIRTYNGGRVFVTKLGHFADVWTTPDFLTHLLQGMRMVAGRIDADFSGHLVKETIAEGVWPDDIAVDEKGNVWIAELRGKLHRYDAETDTTTQIAHIETTDPTKIEHGLYGVEIDPNFYEGEPYVYLYYAEPESFINTLARFEYRDGALDLASEEVLLRVPTEPQCCHQAGDLEWGPDSTLYLSTGDTGMSETRPSWELSEEEIQAFMEREGLTDYHWSRLVDSERSAQNLTDLRGKILRINKDGSIPKDNPFFGEPGVRWEIYAYGLRNPYRFKVDPETKDVYIGVVGPDAAYDYDEYNLSENGGENFGWPRTMGRLFMNEWTPEMIPDYVPPIWEYTYASGGRSATVGPVYKHEGEGAFPAAFQDKVFVYDWARRWIKWADVEEETFQNDVESDVKTPPLETEVPAKRLTNIKLFDQLTTTAPISMELGPDGSLYLAEFDGFWDAGPNAKVTRYRWVTGDEAPINEATGQAEDKPSADTSGER